MNEYSAVFADSKMSKKIEIRESRTGESAKIESLYAEAFPDEDLVFLVRDLLNDPAVALSLVGVVGSHIVGNAILTKCGVVGCCVNAALLGPVAVAPAWQGQGIGGSMVRAGLRQMEDTGVE